MKSTFRRMMASAAMISTLFLAPAAFAQEAPAAPAAVPMAEGQGPAMWVIRDEDSTLYLFGSYHMLKRDTAWGQAHVDAAFASADEIWFELTDLNDTAQATRLIGELGMTTERPLSSLLTAEEMALLDEVVKPLGASAAAFEQMRPWFVSMQLAVIQLMRSGFDPQAGVETVLMSRAAAMGKPVKGFETMREQFTILANISEEGQVEMLRATLRDLQKTPEQMEKLAVAWASGDVAEIERQIVDEMKTAQPDAYEAMLTRRNANWVEQIQGLLAGSGTVFIAVGAGHLAGEDSVQEMLAARGIVAERVLE